MKLTENDIKNLRQQYENISEDGILCDLAYLEIQIEKYKETIACWNEQYKLLDTILDERVK